MSNVQNGTFNRLVTTDTTANSLIVGGATANATAGTGGIKAGPIVGSTVTGTTQLIGDSGVIAGQMPATGAYTVKAIHDMTGTTDKLAGFFAVKSSVDASSLQALEGYAYSTVAGASTIALTIATIGNAEHAGTGTVTALRGMESGVLITNTGGGTDAPCYHASPSGRTAGGSGTFTNGYGFMVGTFGAGFTNKYSLYSSDATASLYHAGDVRIEATQKLYLDGGGDSYLVESAANIMNVFAGGAKQAEWRTNTVSFQQAYTQTTASAASVFVDTDGQLLRSTSSLKYKTDRQPITTDEAQRIVSSLDAFTYRSLCPKDDPNRRFMGFSAEQMAEVAPELAQFSDTGEPEGVDYARMVVCLSVLLKSQDARISALEQRL